MNNDQDTSTLLPKNCLNIFYTNAESLRHKLDTLRAEAYDCDIVCVVETWLDGTISDEQLDIPGYGTVNRRDREKRDQGIINHGGVCVYVKNELANKRRRDLEGKDLEVLWLEILTNKGKFSLELSIDLPLPWLITGMSSRQILTMLETVQIYLYTCVVISIAMLIFRRTTLDQFFTDKACTY